jgi:hypothetical protein
MDRKELIKKTIEMIKKTVSLGTFKRTPAAVINKVIVLEMQEAYPSLSRGRNTCVITLDSRTT